MKFLAILNILILTAVFIPVQIGDGALNGRDDLARQLTGKCIKNESKDCLKLLNTLDNWLRGIRGDLEVQLVDEGRIPAQKLPGLKKETGTLAGVVRHDLAKYASKTKTITK
ncbi:hypothetical protein BGZ82_011309 [Podila clonocystis]|nr:hypothetical protein BGZ82_011309 [Podila clonocystis]